MRILLSVVLLTLVWIGTASAEGVNGPWGMNLGNAQQTAAIKQTLPLPKDVQVAVRYLKPSVIRNQNYWCVPYARAVSGLALKGNAWTWWRGAQGRYARGAAPEVGSVLVFKKIRSMRLGHVATVSEVVNSRMIRVDHANWVRGEIHRGALIKDVSKANDWSQVRVWYPPTDDFGTTTYPVYGFIYPRAAHS